MPAYQPTEEQQAAIDAFATGDDLVLEAGAGTGKTSTLKFLAAARPTQRGIYLAFNKAIQKEAEGSFPRSVRARTAHSFAFRWMSEQWGRTALLDRLNGPRLPAMQTAKILGLMYPLTVGEGKVIQPAQQARIVSETVARFCRSADVLPEKWHVPQVNGAEDPEARAAVVERVLPAALKMWDDLSTPRGKLRFTHDHYLAAYAISEPVIDCDYLLFDECQDADPRIASIVSRQTHAQVVAVGDQSQAIYGWRGSTDYLAKMDAPHRLYLSQSFRFGQPVADEANKWLSLLDARLRLTGNPDNPSMLSPLRDPDAVLCRSNAEAVTRLMRYHGQHVPAAIVGGGNDVKRLAEAAVELKERGQTWHPELCAFPSWSMVQDYVENDHGGQDLKVAVKLIDEYGAEAIIDAIDKAVPENRAQVVLSTAHKAKGREWRRVQIADDFHPPKDDDSGEKQPPAREESMLAYVAVTRARQVLDPSGLEWVNEYVGGGPERVAS